MYTFVVITIVATMPEKFCQSFYSLRPKKYCTSSFSFRFFWNHQYFSSSRNKMLLYHIFERSTSAHFTGIITYISIIQPSLKIKKTYMFLIKGQDLYREGGGWTTGSVRIQILVPLQKWLSTKYRNWSSFASYIVRCVKDFKRFMYVLNEIYILI